MSCGGRRGKKKVLAGPNGEPILDKNGKVQYVVKTDAKGNPIKKNGKLQYEYDEHPAGNGTTGFGGMVSAFAAVQGVPISDARKFVHGVQTARRANGLTYPDPSRDEVVSHFRGVAGRLAYMRDNPRPEDLENETLDAWQKRFDGYIAAVTREANWHATDPDSKLPSGIEFSVLQSMPPMLKSLAEQNRCENCKQFVSPYGNGSHMCPPPKAEDPTTPVPNLNSMMGSEAQGAAGYDPDSLYPIALPLPPYDVDDLHEVIRRTQDPSDGFSAGQAAAQDAAQSAGAQAFVDAFEEMWDKGYFEEGYSEAPTTGTPTGLDDVGVGWSTDSADTSAATMPVPVVSAPPMSFRERIKSRVLSMFGVQRCEKCGRYSDPTSHSCFTVWSSNQPSPVYGNDDDGYPIDGPIPVQNTSDYMEPTFGGEAKGVAISGMRLTSRFLLNPRGWALMMPYAGRAALIAAPMLIFGAGPLAPFALMASAFFMYRAHKWMKSRPPEDRAALIDHYEKPFSWQQRPSQEYAEDPYPQYEDQPPSRSRR